VCEQISQLIHRTFVCYATPRRFAFSPNVGLRICLPKNGQNFVFYDDKTIEVNATFIQQTSSKCNAVDNLRALGLIKTLIISSRFNKLPICQWY